jgi:hypothetical protein
MNLLPNITLVISVNAIENALPVVASEAGGARRQKQMTTIA